MICPKCKHQETRVVDSRTAENQRAVRRRRECEQCGLRFTTFERLEITTLMVQKNDGSHEPFSREKVKRGIILSCGKRPVTREQIEQIVSQLEEKWSSQKEIAAKTIGQDIMNALKKLDDVAFIRFASVYRSFKDVEEFKKEITELFD
jgi:transcriptional repressor NrdR